MRSTWFDRRANPAHSASALTSTGLPMRGVTPGRLPWRPSGELHARLAGVEQAVRGVDVDLVGAADMPGDDVLERRQEAAQEGVVAGCLEVPQGGIDGVLLRGDSA